MTEADLSDEEIMRRVTAADPAAFRALLSRFERKVYSLAWRLTGSKVDAEDLTQDVFLKVWKNAAAWQPTSGLDAWLYRVAYNNFIDKQRRRRPTEELDGETLVSPLDSPETALLKKAKAQNIQDAVNALPPRQKEALVLCYYQDLKAKEAADVLGLTLGATEALLFRARQALKDLLGKEK